MLTHYTDICNISLNALKIYYNITILKRLKCCQYIETVASSIEPSRWRFHCQSLMLFANLCHKSYIFNVCVFFKTTSSVVPYGPQSVKAPPITCKQQGVIVNF